MEKLVENAKTKEVGATEEIIEKLKYLIFKVLIPVAIMNLPWRMG